MNVELSRNAKSILQLSISALEVAAESVRLLNEEKSEIDEVISV